MQDQLRGSQAPALLHVHSLFSQHHHFFHCSLCLARRLVVQVFREDAGAWVVAPMHSVVHNLRSIAQAADHELRRAGQRPDKLGDCGDQLRKCFAVSLQAPGG